MAIPTRPPSCARTGKAGKCVSKKDGWLCVCFWHLLKMIVFELFLETWFKLNCLENDDPTTMGPENDTAWKCNEVPWGSMRFHEVPWGSMRRMRFLCQLYKFQDVLRGRRQSCCKSCQERFSAQELGHKGWVIPMMPWREILALSKRIGILLYSRMFNRSEKISDGSYDPGPTWSWSPCIHVW